MGQPDLDYPSIKLKLSSQMSLDCVKFTQLKLNYQGLPRLQCPFKIFKHSSLAVKVLKLSQTTFLESVSLEYSVT